MKAFTLTEIIVVMSIMLLLMGASITVYRHCAGYTFDAMPEALRYTHALAMSEGYAAMLVRQDSLGNWSICMKVQGIPAEAVIDLDTKRIQVSNYDPAVVVYNRRGHLLTGFDVIIDGQTYTSTNRLVIDGEVKWLHRYAGEFIRQRNSPAGLQNPLPSPRWNWKGP